MNICEGKKMNIHFKITRIGKIFFQVLRNKKKKKFNFKIPQIMDVLLLQIPKEIIQI